MRGVNTVLITVDSLRADAVDGAGAPGVRTPHLEELLSSGTVFSQAIANGPCTQASFPSILCLLYPLVAGEREGLPDSATTLGGSGEAEAAPAFAEAMHSGGRESRMGIRDRFCVMACRNPAWKLISDDESPREELYDPANDPGERRDLIPQRRDAADSMGQLLRKHEELVRRTVAFSKWVRGERIADGEEDVRRRLAALGCL